MRAGAALLTRSSGPHSQPPVLLFSPLYNTIRGLFPPSPPGFLSSSTATIILLHLLDVCTLVSDLLVSRDGRDRAAADGRDQRRVLLPTLQGGREYCPSSRTSVVRVRARVLRRALWPLPCSARTARTTGGKRTTRSSGCVALCRYMPPACREVLTAYMCVCVQFDPIDREGIEAPASSVNKEGVYQCKKHGSPCTCLGLPLPVLAWFAERCLVACNQCYGWKKQITRARTAAKKANRK